jgi:hypothetical protein
VTAVKLFRPGLPRWWPLCCAFELLRLLMCGSRCLPRDWAMSLALAAVPLVGEKAPPDRIVTGEDLDEGLAESVAPARVAAVACVVDKPVLSSAADSMPRLLVS